MAYVWKRSSSMFTHNPHSAHKILNVPASPEYWLFQLMANRRFHSFELAGDILLTMTTETWKQIIFVKADTKIQTIGSSINNVCIQCADTIYRWMLGYVDGWYSIKHPFLQSCFHTHSQSIWQILPYFPFDALHYLLWIHKLMTCPRQLPFWNELFPAWDRKIGGKLIFLFKFWLFFFFFFCLFDGRLGFD